MAGAVALVFESLKKSFDLKLWLCYLLISFLNIVVFFCTFLILLVPSTAVFYVLGSGTLSFAIWALIAIIGLILFLYIGATVWAIFLFIAKDFTEKGKISLGESWNNALQRAPSLFFATAIIFLFFFILLSAFAYPSMVTLAEAFSKISINPADLANPQAVFMPLLQSLMLFLAMMAFFFIIAVVVSPFTVLVAPTVVFENIPAFAGIKKAIVAAKENYFSNLLSIMLYSIIAIAINVFFFAIGAAVDFFASFFASSQGFPVIKITLDVIKFIVQVFSTIITLSLLSVFSVNYYKANFFGAIKEKTQPQKGEEAKSELKEERPEENEPGAEPPAGGETAAVPEQGAEEAKTIKLEPWMGKRI